MPRSRFAGSLTSPKVDVVIDMGNPFLNRTVDGFLKIGTVAASRVAAEETYHCLRTGSVSKHKMEETGYEKARLYFVQVVAALPMPYVHEWANKFGNSIVLKKMCKEGAYWGTVAGVYVGMEYGVERIRGTNDWKNALLGGAITGALISVASNKSRDKVMVDAITGGAVATAAEFLNYLT